MNSRSVLITMALVSCGFLPRWAYGCPFCSAVSQTFGEEIASMDVVVIARLVSTPPPPDAASQPNAELAKSKFEITRVIKGQQWLHESKVVETLYFGEAMTGQSFLIMGADPPDVMWSTPLLLSERGQDYITRVVSLPAGPERLEFFQDYLEDQDEMLARDAYDEFAKAPYADVKKLVDKMDHDQLVEWIQSTEIPVSRRRLYVTMLGVCGSEADTPMLEQMLRSEDRNVKAGLDALIACYLMLKGPEGMPLVEELFLKNESAEYADTYAAIMALRFHGTESDVIGRPRLLEGLRHMLGRPQLADLVIPDLARWEDWSVKDRLVELFKEADEESSWVRVPVINYLRACPLPEAKALIDQLAQIDPEAVKRANTFFPFAAAASTSGPSAGNASDAELVAPTPVALPDGGQSQADSVSSAAPNQEAATAIIADDTAVPSGLVEPATANGGPKAADTEGTTPPASPQVPDDRRPPVRPRGQVDVPAGPAPLAVQHDPIDSLLVVGVLLVIGLVLLVVMWFILRGTRRQVIS
jgi:hypothetical protein